VGGRAIVVEDDAQLRGVIASVLRSLDVDVVADGDSVPRLADIIDQARPDVVILDLVVTGTTDMSDSLRDITTLAPRTPVVVFSAHDGLRGQALAAGARAFVDKPDFDALGRVVLEVLAAAPTSG
jgi:CheY-like chemotaxis protein